MSFSDINRHCLARLSTLCRNGSDCINWRQQGTIWRIPGHPHHTSPEIRKWRCGSMRLSSRVSAKRPKKCFRPATTILQLFGKFPYDAHGCISCLIVIRENGICYSNSERRNHEPKLVPQPLTLYLRPCYNVQYPTRQLRTYLYYRQTLTYFSGDCMWQHSRAVCKLWCSSMIEWDVIVQ